jgi:hypothetical protein
VVSDGMLINGQNPRQPQSSGRSWLSLHFRLFCSTQSQLCTPSTWYSRRYSRVRGGCIEEFR